MTKMEIVAITPEHAAWVLENKNPHNRNLRTKDVATYARDMAAGHWKNTGEAIKFASDGNLLDGQHRLQAVVDSGTTVEFLVLTGDLDQEQMDSGVKRIMSDVLKLRGEANYIVLATMLRSVCRWDDEQKTFTNRGPSRSEMFALLDREPWVRSLIPAVHALKADTGLPTPVGSVAAYMFWQIDADDTLEFFRRVRLGGGDEHDAAFRLHRWLANENNRKTTGERAMLAITIKAWNAYRDGSPILALRYRASDYRPEAFPLAH